MIKNTFGELTELHVHVGSAVDPPIMWEIAHMQGIKLPTKNYWEFEKLITLSGVTTFENYLKLFHWTELIQSSPEAMERCVYSIASGAYRKNNITTLELRFNPMKRNRGGERDLDHIILSSLHSMQRAMLAYPIKVGMILCCDRTFTPKQNEIICQKAMKYRSQGIVGIDLAGPNSKEFTIESIVFPFTECKKEGLGVTIHTGEVTGPDEIKTVIQLLNPDRIGHGIQAVKDEKVLELLKERGIVLEICPTSNLLSEVVNSWKEFKGIFDTFKKYDIPFTINTDNPEMLKTNLVKEYQLLLDNHILTKEDLKKCTEITRKATFIK